MEDKQKQPIPMSSLNSRCLIKGVHHTLLCIAVVCIMTLGFSKNSPAFKKSLPFQPGEKLTFTVKWCFIPAAEAVLEILPTETIQDVAAHHFAMKARTYPFIDLFYKVRDRIDAFTDREMTRSILYTKQKKGKHKKDVRVAFNWEKQEVRYSDGGKKRKPIIVKHGSFDPLSVFYAFRLYDLKIDTKLKIPVTDGKKCVMGKATVVKREKIRVADKTYDTYLVEPELEHIGGVFEKSKTAKLKIWVTADNRKIPVKIKSKVIVGSFVAEVTSMEGIR